MFALLELNKTNGTGDAIVSLFFVPPCIVVGARWWWAVLCHTPQLWDISDICIPGSWRRRGARSAGVTREKVPAAEAEERRYQGETKNIHQPVFLPAGRRSEVPWSPRHQHSPSPTSTISVGGQIWVSGVFSHYQPRQVIYHGIN